MATARTASGRVIEAPVVDVPGRLVYQALSGSNAYGLAGPGSDIDWRGVFQVPTDDLFKLSPIPQTAEPEDDGHAYWELSHFARQCLAGNPNIVEMLWTDRSLVAVTSPVMEEFRAMREHFFSSTMVARYLGWAQDELRIMAPAFKGRRSGRVPATVADWDVERLSGKRGSHLVRMLMSLRCALRIRRLTVTMEPGPDRDLVLAIKGGRVGPEQVVATVESLCRECESLAARSGWPARDMVPVEALLRRARLGQLG
jgi:hypothetical protein